MAKVTKASVDYSLAKDVTHRCGRCKHFEVLAKGHCEIVEGAIEAGHWCKRWEPKSRARRMYANPRKAKAA